MFHTVHTLQCCVCFMQNGHTVCISCHAHILRCVFHSAHTAHHACSIPYPHRAASVLCHAHTVCVHDGVQGFPATPFTPPTSTLLSTSPLNASRGLRRTLLHCGCILPFHFSDRELGSCWSSGSTKIVVVVVVCVFCRCSITIVQLFSDRGCPIMDSAM